MIDPSVIDAVVLTVGAGGDALSTRVALSRCTSCRELGPPAPVRYGLDAAVIGGAVLTARELRKRGHKGWARTVVALPFALWLGVSIHNLRVR